MADNTVTSAVDDLMRELETVREALLMAVDDCNVGEVVYNAVQSVRAVTETIRNRREDRQQILTKAQEYNECPVTLLRIPLPMFLKPGQTSEDAVCHAASVIFNLCKVVEKEERAVSEGAVTAVVDKIRSRVLVNEMLEILEVLSWHEKAVVVECLFEVLGEVDVKEKDKEYCVSIVHGMCGDDVAKTRKLINEVENARDALERVVSSGTTMAKEKASKLLWKLDLDDNLAEMEVWLNIDSFFVEF